MVRSTSEAGLEFFGFPTPGHFRPGEGRQKVRVASSGRIEALSHPTPASGHHGNNSVLRPSSALRVQIAPGEVERPPSGESELLSDRFRSTVPGLGEVGYGSQGHPRLLRREGPGAGEIPNGAENFAAGCSDAVGASDTLQNRSRQPVD